LSNDDLSLFSYEILGLVGREGAGAHDLLRMARRARFLDWAGESQYYAEPKRLARLGYLEARRAPGRTRERTVYALTEQGLAALRAWARTPARFTPLKSEPLLRVLVADLVGLEATLDGLAPLRDDLADLRARIHESAAVAEALPHRREYLLLVLAFFERLFDLYGRLVDDVERLEAVDEEVYVAVPSEPEAVEDGR
jgi:DNA-binding PadR family transcriptional regulator